MKRIVAAASLAAFVLASGAPAALAARRGGTTSAAASCVVGDGVVSATGLPTDQVINFFVESPDGTTGWVLGYTSLGTWDVDVEPASEPTTYLFTSKTWGPGGSKFTVFASCS